MNAISYESDQFDLNRKSKSRIAELLNVPIQKPQRTSISSY